MQRRFILRASAALFSMASSFCFADKFDDLEGQNMAFVAQGGGSFPMLGGGSFGGGGRFEYAFSRFASLFVPAEYRFVSMEKQYLQSGDSGDRGEILLVTIILATRLTQGVLC